MNHLESAHHTLPFHECRPASPTITGSIKPHKLHTASSSNVIHHDNSSLPRLSTLSSSRGDSAENPAYAQPKLVIYHEIVPSRAVAQSMMTMLNSCPELTKIKQREVSPVADGRLRRVKKNGLRLSPSNGGSANDSSDSDALAPSGLIRCRVPLSVASSLQSVRRSALGYITSLTGVAGPVYGSDGEGVGAACAAVPPITMSPRRRPGTQEGPVSYNSSSGSLGLSSGQSTPVTSRRRRLGQYAVTAANDIVAEARANLSKWAASARQEGSALASARTGSGTLQNSMPDVFSRLHKDTRRVALPLSDNSNSRLQPPNTARTQGGSQTIRTPNARLKVGNNNNNNNINGNSGVAKPEVLQAKSSTDAAQNENSSVAGEHEDDLTKGMALETYDRCVQWVKDVQSAKGSRTLETIMLPPVQTAD